MIQTVIKRDGRIVGFNEEKIATAIRKAMLHTDKGEDLQLIHQITDHIAFRGAAQMTVEAIQDMVELELMKSSRKDVAQKYIAYRNQRSIARKAKTRDMFLEIINIKSNDITRENANMNADTPAGMMMKFASETTKPFVDDYLLSEEALNAVKGNYLHIHDKDYYPTKSLTCVQHPLDRILTHGFSAGHGESRPAKRIETASILGCISLETAQNEMHGGQAIPAFDFYLAPYVRYSFIEEVKTLEQLNAADYSHLYHKELDDYLQRPLEGLQGEERLEYHPLTRWQPGGVQLHQLRYRHVGRRTLHHPRTTEQYLSGSGQRRNGYLPHPDLEKETRRQLPARRPQLRPLPAGLQGDGPTLLPQLPESGRHLQPERGVEGRRPQTLPARSGYHGMPHACVREPFRPQDIGRPW